MVNLISFFESNFIIPIEKGDILYHSSTFEFLIPKIGKDKVFWTTKNKIISRCYIVDWNNHNSLGSNEFLSVYGLGGKIIAKDPKNPMDVDIKFDKKHPFYKKTQPEMVKILDSSMKKKGIKSKKIGKVIHYDYDKQKYLSLDKNEYIIPGYTYEFKVKEKLKLYDMTKGKSPDPKKFDFHKYDEFNELIKKGYDGVYINDFTYEDKYGFGAIAHTSFGFFEKGLNKIELINITEEKRPSEKEILSLVNKKIY